jgi:putative DNA primase/helicase
MLTKNDVLELQHAHAEAVFLAPDIGEPRGDEKNGWLEPLPLPSDLPKVMAFDFDLLPDTLRAWVEDICDRMQCPPDFVAVTVMAGLGAIIGRRVGIRPQDKSDWLVLANLWAMLIGRPGFLKSPSLEAALKPLQRLIAEALKVYEGDIMGFDVEVRAAKLRAEEGEKSARKALSRDPTADISGHLAAKEPAVPILRRYLVVDTNVASLGEIHRQNPNGLLVHRDEMVSLLKTLDREDQSEARGFYLTGWNGDSSYTFDRIGRGLNLHIPGVCLSMVGGTQPGRIAEYMQHAIKGGAGDDGLIQRFGLMVWPDVVGEWCNVDRWANTEAKNKAFEVYKALDVMDVDAIGAQQDFGPDGEPEGIPYLRFADDAQVIFLEWRTNMERRLRGGDLHLAMESHLSKYRKLIPGLALILHLAGGGVGPVSKRATLQALAWGEYLETHAQRAYSSATAPGAATAKAILAKIRKGDLGRTFSSRDVWRPGWAGLTDRELVVDALRLLVDYDWLSAARHETGGRPSTVYEVNPRGFE